MNQRLRVIPAGLRRRRKLFAGLRCPRDLLRGTLRASIVGWTFVYRDATLHRLSASTQMPARGNPRG